MSLGPWEIVLVVLVIIMLFGGKKIPELARGLSKGLKEFRKTTNDWICAIPQLFLLILHFILYYEKL